jgi:hypothetical protein
MGFSLMNMLGLSSRPDTDRTENVASITACSLVVGETACP